MNTRLALATGAAAACLVTAAVVRPEAHPRATTSLSWQADVQPIIERRCSSCHRDGGVAPMSFEDYEKTRPWARAIREAILERRMPPTAVRSGAGLYDNARTLSLGEMELLSAWVDGGAPSGDEPFMVATNGPPGPPPPKHEIPTPEWNLTLDGTLDPAETDVTRKISFAMPAGWIGGWTFEAGGLPIRVARLTLADGTVVGSWTPDEGPVAYPEGSGIRVEKAGPAVAEVKVLASGDAPAEGAKPQLKLLMRPNAQRRVVRRALTAASTPITAAEQLLSVRLELADPEGVADVQVARKSGDHDFLMMMAPPGNPDPISYRLRRPLTLQPGDQLTVDANAAFTLEVETVDAARAAKPTGRE